MGTVHQLRPGPSVPAEKHRAWWRRWLVVVAVIVLPAYVVAMAVELVR